MAKFRSDAQGFFWHDEPVVHVPKEKVARTPPEPRWFDDDALLPYLDEAIAFDIPPLDIETALKNKEKLVFDIEVHPNYFLAAFRGVESGHVLIFEAYEPDDSRDLGRRLLSTSVSNSPVPLDTCGLRWVLENFTTIGFNSRSFDLPVCAVALSGAPLRHIKEASNLVISEALRPFELFKKYGAKKIECDHIDLRDVAPMAGSLKIYAARLHAKTLQDLPVRHEYAVNANQRAAVRWYCVDGDLPATAALYRALEPQIALREAMGAAYGVDLRSRSDAQIAEDVIAREIRARTKSPVTRPVVDIGAVHRYRAPTYLRFRTDALRGILAQICDIPLIVGSSGAIDLPAELANLSVCIGNSTYRLGLGGLHSSEKCVSHYSDDNFQLIDKDVTSYYPAIVLNLGLYPRHLGPIFLAVYRHIVNERIEAKRAGNKTKAEMLKITVNGTFGKFGSRYSAMYAPELVAQVTLTGQLSLLFLIESLELWGFPVVSANTDGIVIKAHRARMDELNQIVAWWENETSFQTEESLFSSLHSRDVNNYIAVKRDGKIKAKGAFTLPESPERALWKNPQADVCIRAVRAFLSTGKPVAEYIEECLDWREFMMVRTVRGGAVQVTRIAGQTTETYLGKAIRFMYFRELDSEIVYAKNGNRVPLSDGAHAMMKMAGRAESPTIDFNGLERTEIAGMVEKSILSDSVEPDGESAWRTYLDFERYANIAESMLADLGVKSA